jgi:uncharacterized protein CbrC (UPF0167 family)
MAKEKVSQPPRFKCHPRPLSTGAIEESDAACECCGRARGFVYRGPIYCTATGACVIAR